MYNLNNSTVEHAISDEQKILTLENRIRELAGKMLEIGQENKLLQSIQVAKTNAIQELSEEVSRRGATEEYVLELTDKVRHLLDKISSLTLYS